VQESNLETCNLRPDRPNLYDPNNKMNHSFYQRCT
jgi:hypothetical protein